MSNPKEHPVEITQTVPPWPTLDQATCPSIKEVLQTLQCCRHWTEHDLDIYTDGPIHDAMQHRAKVIANGLIAAQRLVSNHAGDEWALVRDLRNALAAAMRVIAKGHLIGEFMREKDALDIPDGIGVRAQEWLDANTPNRTLRAIGDQCGGQP